MRNNLLASSICNPKVITREMELNYKKIWMEYLSSGFRDQGSGVRSLESGDAVGDAISAASRLRMAMVKLEAGEYSQAMEISSSLLDKNGVSHLAWYILGVSRFRLGREQDAVDALNQSLSLNRNNPGARELLEEIRLRSAALEEQPFGL